MMAATGSGIAEGRADDSDGTGAMAEPGAVRGGTLLRCGRGDALADRRPGERAEAGPPLDGPLRPDRRRPPPDGLARPARAARLLLRARLDGGALPGDDA